MSGVFQPVENVTLLPGERIDDLQCKGYGIIQHPDKFCFGIDAVLLAAYGKVKAKEKMLDLGTGTGILPILMAAKTPGKHFTGVEIQPESVDMARRSVKMNGLEDRIDILEGDIAHLEQVVEAGAFHVVVSNPPYMPAAHGFVCDNPQKALARQEIACTLADVIAQGARALVEKGRFYMVHRPERLGEIIVGFHENGIEVKGMRLVYPYVHKEPRLVLIEGLKGGRPGMKAERPLVVYENDGTYTEEVLGLYGQVQQEAVPLKREENRKRREKEG